MCTSLEHKVLIVDVLGFLAAQSLDLNILPKDHELFRYRSP